MEIYLRKKSKKKYLLVLYFTLTTFLTFSQAIFTSTKDGIWNDNGIDTPWTITGSDSDGIPDFNDHVIINHLISTPSAVCASKDLTINLTGELALNSSGQLNIYGDVNVSGILSSVSNSSIIDILGNVTISGSGTITSAITLYVEYQKLTINTDLVVDGPIYLRAGGDIYLNNSQSLTINFSITSNSSVSQLINYGNLIVNSSNFFNSLQSSSNIFYTNYSTSHVNLNFTGNLPNPVGSQYNDLTISGNISSSNDYSIAGDLICDASFINNSNTITFNGLSSQSISGNGTLSIHNLNLDNSNGLNLNSSTVNVFNFLSSTSGSFTQNGADIILKSSSDNNAGLLSLNSASDYSYSSGNFSVERYYNGLSNGWRMVAAPIKNATLSDWDDEFIYCGISGGIGNFSYSVCGNFYSVYYYDESLGSPSLSDGLVEVTSLTHNVSSGNGTLIYSGSGATTIFVSGEPELGNISKPVTKINDGWNLVANPYPSTIDWTNGVSGFYDENSGLIDNAWYAYSADAGNYLSSTNDIPHSQGFWVKANSSNNLNFSISQTTATQSNFVKSTNGINLPLTLKVSNNVNSYYDFAYLQSGPSYSNNYDQGHDVFEFFSPDPDFVPNIYFFDAQGNKLDRSCINNNQSEDIYFDIEIGHLAQGNYDINFNNLNQFMIGSCLQMEDLHNGIFTDLRLDSSYSFLSDTLAPSPRFVLHIDVDFDISVTNSSCYNDSSASIKIRGSNLIGSFFKLIDSTGITIDSILANSDSVEFNGLNSGIYDYETNYIGRCQTLNQKIHIVSPSQVLSNFSIISDTFYFDSLNQIEIYFKNLSTGSNYYIWDFDDGTNSTNYSTYHTFNNSGIYDIKLVSMNDSLGTCKDSITKQIVLIDEFVDLQDFNTNQLEILINHKIINIKFLQSYVPYDNIKIIDLKGSIIYESNFSKAINSLSIPINNFKTGIYFINLNSLENEHFYIEKFVHY